MKKQCSRCIYFVRDPTNESQEEGTCHRHAPSPAFVEQNTAAGVALLTWWYMREVSIPEHGLQEASKIADEQLKDFSLETEIYENQPWSSWPKVFDDDWCGDWTLDRRKKSQKNLKKIKAEQTETEREQNETTKDGETESSHEVKQG